MNGYDEESVVRSVRRYFSGLLQQPWSVGLERVEVRDDQRPAGLIELGEVRTRMARVSVPQGEVDEFAPLTMTLWPTMKSGADWLTPQAAGRNARLLARQVRELIASGAEGVSLAGPERLPLWDYSATAPGSPAPGSAIDVLWAEDYSVRALQDPIDARRWAVILEARLSWERPGRAGPAAEPWTGITPVTPTIVLGEPDPDPEDPPRDDRGFLVWPPPSP